MITIIDWPCCSLPVTAWDQPALQGAQVLGPESIGGVQQSLASPTWRWRMGATITIHRPDQSRALLGFLARLDGIRGTIRVPICSPGLTVREPWEVLYRDGIPWTGDGGDRLFAEGMGWAYPGRGYEVPLAAPATRGAPDITIPMAVLAGVLRPGHHITIGEDMHIVQGVWAAPGGTRIDIMPPLRRDHAAGTAFYARATGLFRLASPEVPRLAQSLGRFGSLNIPLVECWERLP
jgi:hypothetical protein